MAISNRDKIRTLLKGIETGDPDAVKVIKEDKYIQHNPLTKEGNVGLAELFKRLAKTSPKVEIVRIFEDGDFVFAHTDYDFNVVEIGFEVFRFEDGFAVEHWDNLQTKVDQPNPSGHTMIDGSMELTDLEKTEENRALVLNFIEQVLLERNFNRLTEFVVSEGYIEHNPAMEDGFPSLSKELTSNNSREYQKIHRILAEGNFVLSVCEGMKEGTHISYYDLFRIADGKIVEHWDTFEEVPPKSEWVNNNGKF